MRITRVSATPPRALDLSTPLPPTRTRTSPLLLLHPRPAAPWRYFDTCIYKGGRSNGREEGKILAWKSTRAYAILYPWICPPFLLSITRNPLPRHSQRMRGSNSGTRVKKVTRPNPTTPLLLFHTTPYNSHRRFADALASDYLSHFIVRPTPIEQRNKQYEQTKGKIIVNKKQEQVSKVTLTLELIS